MGCSYVGSGLAMDSSIRGRHVRDQRSAVVYVEAEAIARSDVRDPIPWQRLYYDIRPSQVLD